MYMDWLYVRRRRRRDGKVSRKWFVDVNVWFKGLKMMVEDVLNFFGGEDKDSVVEVEVVVVVDENVSVFVDEF